MADAISVNRMEPVIDKTFALALMKSGVHFGKVAIATGRTAAYQKWRHLAPTTLGAPAIASAAIKL
jgi:hypothetical protein